MHRSLFSSAGLSLASSLAAVTLSVAQPATVLSPVEVEAPPRPAAKPRVPRSGNEAGRPEARHVAAPTLGAGGMSVTPGASAAQALVASASEKTVSGAEVNARPLPSFDTRDRSHVRFGSLEYRSGLILTSRFRGFGGLSGLRLDAKGERFIALSDKGSWFTGRIVYKGREMTGLDDVEASPMLGPDGKPITARGWFDSESIALDGSMVYVGLERINQLLRFDFA